MSEQQLFNEPEMGFGVERDAYDRTLKLAEVLGVKNPGVVIHVALMTLEGFVETEPSFVESLKMQIKVLDMVATLKAAKRMKNKQPGG